MLGVMGLLASAPATSLVALPSFRATLNSWLIPMGDQLAYAPPTVRDISAAAAEASATV